MQSVTLDVWHAMCDGDESFNLDPVYSKVVRVGYKLMMA